MASNIKIRGTVTIPEPTAANQYRSRMVTVEVDGGDAVAVARKFAKAVEIIQKGKA